MLTYRSLNYIFLLVLTSLVFTSNSLASDFNLPFVSAAGLGNMYAGWAVDAEDASTWITNPAGLTHIKNKQVVGAGLLLFGETTFTGDVRPPFPPAPANHGLAQSNLWGPLGSFYYAQPFSDRLYFGFGATTPWGLGTRYGQDSFLRYASTKAQIGTVDFGPGLAYQLTDRWSVGAGLDIDYLFATLNNYIGNPPLLPDGKGQNDIRGWGHGFHVGTMVDVTSCTRLGVNFNSGIRLETEGVSKLLYEPAFANRSLITRHLTSHINLPAMVQFSALQNLTQNLSVVGTAFYTNWSVIKQIELRNFASPGGFVFATVPFNYRDTVDYSLGLNYHYNERWTWRTGFEVLNTPTNNRDRLVADPLGDGIIAALGFHFQPNCKIGFDAGYAHGFFKREPINRITQIASEIGFNRSNTNIIGGQINWNFD